MRSTGQRRASTIVLAAVVTMTPGPGASLAAQEPEAPATAAAEPEAPDAEADVEATHEALRELRREVEASFNAAGRSGRLEDFQGVLDRVHDDAVLAAMNGDLVVGKEQIIEYFNTKMTGAEGTIESIRHTFEPAGLTILYGGDTGVAYGTSRGTYELVGGLDFEVDTHWTSTLVLEDGRWLIASFQFGPSIFDNPILDRAVRGMSWGIGLAAAAGLLVGLLIGRRAVKRAA